jgi:hypothetical protein
VSSIDTLAKATEMWTHACRHPDKLLTTVTLLRGDRPAMLLHVTARIDANSRQLLAAGVFPMIAPTPDIAVRTLKPLFADLGVEAAIMVAKATIVQVGGAPPARVLMAWIYEPAESLEVTWCRALGDDGILREVSLAETEVVGTDWIRAAL